MKAIGFNNFRQFKEFPLLQLADVTIFVGGNNAGKSTVVKAIVTVLTFLKEAPFDVWRNKKAILDNNLFFNKNSYAHIGTFKRALCNNAESDTIRFSIIIEELHFVVDVKGDINDENAVAAKVQCIQLTDFRSRISFNINFSANNISVHLKPNFDMFKENEDFARRYERLRNKLEKDDDSTDPNNSATLRMFFSQYPLVTNEDSFNAEITEICEKRIAAGPLISGLIINMLDYFDDKFESNESKDNDRQKQFVSIFPYISRLARRIDVLMRFSPVVEYLYAHSASQIVLYNSLDTSDFLVQTIHNFASLRLPSDGHAYEFVRYWMKKFNIGIDFEICTIGGEAHTLNIIDSDEKKMPLADKGMGSIQLMILLLRLAIDINEKQADKIQRNSPLTILVEEPEQNLHPKVQSLLMDFFYQVNQQYGIRFVIETHSEYLVRRSQVIVAENKYKNSEELKARCPIKVYYFPKEGVPRDMEFGINGRFQNTFDPGFFDEATVSSFTLSRLERRNISSKL